MNYTMINEKTLREVYSRRDSWSHKGDYGKLLVVGGGREYTGSPALVALSALRSGCDFVKILAPLRSAEACANFSPEIIAIPYERDYLDPNAMTEIDRLSQWAKAVEIGNGIGRDRQQSELVKAVQRSVKKKLVIDADGLKVLDKNLLNFDTLLTPNSYEFEVLFDAKLTRDIDERVKIVKEKAKEFGTVILLKGHVDIVSDGEEVFINKTNSPYMTKAGTGDTLAGIASSLIAQGNSMVDSACAAAFINGYTGRVVAKAKKEALSPVDIINNMYITLSKFRY
ncbi:MAG: NAD(P)H-hydrate dehydratase [Candidatus Acidifodinimicrobium sp.]